MKKENLKIILTSIASFVLGGATIVGANQAIHASQNTEIKVSLNGVTQAFKDETTGEVQYPITYNNRTYLPLRNIAQLTGLNVSYTAYNNMASLDGNTGDDFLYSNITGMEDELDGLCTYTNKGEKTTYNYQISKDGKNIHIESNGKNYDLPTNLNNNIKSFKMMFNISNPENITLVMATLTEDGEVYISSSVSSNLQSINKVMFYRYDNYIEAIALGYSKLIKPYIITKMQTTGMIHVNAIPKYESTSDYNETVKEMIENNNGIDKNKLIFDIDMDGIVDLYCDYNYGEDYNEPALYSPKEGFLCSIDLNNENIIQTEQGTYIYHRYKSEKLNYESLEKITNIVFDIEYGVYNIETKSELHHSISEDRHLYSDSTESIGGSFDNKDFLNHMEEINSYKIIHSLKDTDKVYSNVL